jgi:hypothetical protein
LPVARSGVVASVKAAETAMQAAREHESDGLQITFVCYGEVVAAAYREAG